MPAEVETMVYVASRGLPWHGLGTSVEDLMTAEEALVASGLDWEVSLQPITIAGTDILIPDKYATVRNIDDKPLGIVGTRYVPLQNRAAFAWADALVDSGEAKFETAGSLRGGGRVFISMELAHLDITVPGDPSKLQTRLIIMTSHDASWPTMAMISQVRPVCSNTCALALSKAAKVFRVKHVSSIEGKVAMARQALGISFRNADLVAALTTKLATKSLLDRQVREIFEKVWPSAGDEPSRLASGAYENYLTSDTLDGIRGTAWGALNAATEYLDHVVKYREGIYGMADTKADSILFGTSAEAKDRILALLSR